MSGLAGCFTQDARVDEAWLAQAGALLCHTDDDDVSRSLHGPVGLVYASTRPAEDRLEVWVGAEGATFFAGEVYNLDELARSAGIPGPRPEVSDRPKLLWQLFQRRGVALLAELNGAFLLGFWHRRDRTLQLATDRMGLRKLYYTVTASGGLYFASEVKALLAHPDVSRAPAPRAVAHLLAFGHLLDDWTLQAAVRLLSAGVRLSHRAGAAAPVLEAYWQLRYATAGSRESVDAYARQFTERLERALVRRLGCARRIGIPLSGGLDSRVLLGFTRRVAPGRPVATLSAGHQHTYDVVYAQRMARVCRTQHAYLPLPHDFMLRHGEAFTWLLDGQVTLHNCWGWEVARAAAAASDRALIGFLGDTLSSWATYFRAPADASDVGALAEGMARRYNLVFPQAELIGLLRAPAQRQAAALVLEDFGRTVRHAQADVPADHTIIAAILQRQQRNTSFMLAMFNAVVPTVAPFVDNEIVDLLTTIPYAGYRDQQQVYLRMIGEVLPALAHVAYDELQLPLDAGWLRRQWHWRSTRLAKRTLAALSGGRWHLHNRRQYVHYGEWLREEPSRSMLQRALTELEPYLAAWCDVEQVRQLLAAHLDGRVNAYRKLSALLTLGYWLRQVDELPAAERPTAAPAGHTATEPR